MRSIQTHFLILFTQIAVFITTSSLEILHSSSEIECGQVKVLKTVELIVGNGSVNAYPGEWPWLVPIFNNSLKNFICGSSLISKNHLLTAAHCVYDGNIEGMIVLPGRFNLSNNSENDWVKRTLTRAFINPEYEHGAKAFKSKGDIAVLRMNENVQYTNKIQPVCLPKLNSETSNQRGIVVGYGYHSGSNKFKETPKQITMDSISFTECVVLHEHYIHIAWKKGFCAKSVDGSPAQGDSGGGYFHLDSETQRYTTLGVVSQKLFTLDSYTSFSDVAKYVDWISEVITKNDSETPTISCETVFCGFNAECSIKNGEVQCKCFEFFLGRPPFCRPPECQKDYDCGDLQICSDLSICIDPCKFNPCGIGSHCVPIADHQFQCDCPNGYEKNGNNGCQVIINSRIETDPCFASFPCDSNSKCINNNGAAECICSNGFIGHSPDCRQPECMEDSQCNEDRMCVENMCLDICSTHQCPENINCIMKNHRPVCQCPSNYKDNGKGECIRNDHLMNGDIKKDNCCQWVGDDYTINRNFTIFQTKLNSKIPTDDFEISQKFKSDEVEKLVIANQCKNGLLYCQNLLNIKFLPIRVAEIFPNLLAYYVFGYSIERVRKVNFENLKKLEFIFLYDNAISTIDADAFEDLTELRFFRSQISKLQYLDDATFKNNLKLERINLHDNQIQNISPQLIGHLHQLTQIDLSRNNLTNLDSHSFSTLYKLKIIRLCGNQLVSLSADIFWNLDQLEELWLEENQLMIIPEELLINNTKLKKISLSDNRISKLSSKIIEDKPVLNYVDLRRNLCINDEYGGLFVDKPLTEEERNRIRNNINESCL